MSDLHIDCGPHPKFDLPDVETLVVAGDTANGLAGLRLLEKWQNKHGRTVLATDGNHEHYLNSMDGRTVEETTKHFRNEYPARATITQFTGKELEQVEFVLTNGWYPVSDEFAWQRRINDAKNCGLDFIDVNTLAINEAAFVESVLKEWKENGTSGVVVTHTAPCPETLDLRYKDEVQMNQWFWNPNMRYLLVDYADQIRVWCHGHTHAPADKIIDGVRIVCNPRGYAHEKNKDWKPIIIEV